VIFTFKPRYIMCYFFLISSTETNPWCQLSQELVKTGSTDAVYEILETLKALHSKNSLPLEVYNAVVMQLLRVQRFYVKIKTHKRVLQFSE
jgi:hypothetical protein